MKKLRVIGLSGNVKAPSRTSALVGSILDEIENRLDTEVRQIDLVDAAPILFRALRADQLDEAGKEIVHTVETADALVVGSPVYRASYSGARYSSPTPATPTGRYRSRREWPQLSEARRRAFARARPASCGLGPTNDIVPLRTLKS